MMPSYPHAHLVRALLCDGDLGDPACAVAEFEQVLRLVPDHPQRSLIDSELARLKAQPPAGSPAVTALQRVAKAFVRKLPTAVSTTELRPDLSARGHLQHPREFRRAREGRPA